MPHHFTLRLPLSQPFLTLEGYQQVFASLPMDTILGIANNAIGLIVQKVTDVSGVKEKMDALEMNMRMVSARKADIVLELEQEERRPGKKRKREVDAWMQNAASLEDRVHKVGRKVEEGHFFSHLTLENQVSGLATQVEKLQEMGRFDHGLTLDVELAGGYELPPGEPVGQASQTKWDEIWDCLIDGEVLRVGPWHYVEVSKWVNLI
ncbi:uncharacterized protein LOC115687643 [Syzygium oleosum]|uniref:uncharacterized protein LOC115687643 n=1 Tax=Syzygium oleosum TaxID=219896 RepID=UPI0024B88FA2|nr:uncharacterized protein LOC115687643 [Syzygium oleosum]